MKRCCLCLLYVFVALSGCRSSAVDAALESLDATIADRDNIERDFGERLLVWKRSIASAEDADAKYEFCDSLYRAYRAYDLDSAYRYLDLKREYAFDCDSREYQLKTLLDKSIIKDVKLLDESIAALECVLQEDDLRPELAGYLDYCGYSLYTYAASVRPSQKDEYQALSREFMDRYLRSGADSYEYAIVRSKVMAGRGEDASIPEYLRAFIDDGASEEAKAHIYYNMALAWEKIGEADSALVCYARSAEADLKRPARKYMSLTKTADLLVARGDNERASRYIRIAADDILSSKSLSVLSSTTACMLNISERVSNMESRQRQAAWSIVILSTVSLLVVALLLARSRKQSRKITGLNESLNRANSELEVSNKIRANYLGTYMIKCAEYIGQVDENVHNLRKTYIEEGAEKLHTMLRNPSYSAAEYERFYREFNDTFLRVFPNFISKVNEVMQPGFEFQNDPQKPWPMELRILAVYRLGLTEYKDIARFLNCALTTVYTYRTRTKRHSKLPSKEFDEYISSMEI